MIIRLILAIALSGMSASALLAQELTLSPYSRYAIGDILGNTTVRNASMGGLTVAPDNYFSINRGNPASYGDLYYTTMDVSAFWQASQLRTQSETGNRYSAGIQNAAFAFPSNNDLIFVFGFSPFSGVGYEVVERQNVTIDDTTLLEQNTYRASGGLNQAFIGLGARLFNRRLKLGVNGQFVFGNTQYIWQTQLFRSDSLLASDYLPLQTTRDVFVNGWIGTAGFIYEDTLNKETLTLFRFGGMVDYTLGMQGDRLTTISNGIVVDTLETSVVGSVAVPPKFGLGFMVNRLGHWSFGADVTYQNWSQFQYFDETSSLGQEIRVSVGGEVTPDLESTRYLRRTDYRFGGYWRQTYLQYDGQQVNDYGVTLGVGLPASSQGNNRFNRGRAVSRINISGELGRRGNLNSGLPLEEWYARVRLGVTINDRWFIRRVID